VILKSIDSFIKCKLDFMLLFVVYNRKLNHLSNWSRLLCVCYSCRQAQQTTLVYIMQACKVRLICRKISGGTANEDAKIKVPKARHRSSGTSKVSIKEKAMNREYSSLQLRRLGNLVEYCKLLQCSNDNQGKGNEEKCPLQLTRDPGRAL